MKIIVTAGGGGHFAAALAVIQAFPKEWETLLIGRKHPFEGDKTLSLESQTATKLGIRFYPLTTGRLQRTFTSHTIPSLLKVPVGFTQALGLLRKERPDVVVSFGGYVAVPVVWAASVLQIPIIIHEQTLRAGLANKLAAPFADKICLSWEQSQQYFPKEKTVVTGNPLMKNYELRIKNHASKESLPMIFITGGSGGAHAINVLVEGCLEKLVHKYMVIHQTGDAKEFGDFDRLTKKRNALPQELHKRYLLTKFMTQTEMSQYIHEASLVVARSGMGTVTQLLSVGKPCLLIPLPHGQRAEQQTNAEFVAKTGIAEVSDQNELTSDKLAQKIDTMIHNLSQYEKHAVDAQKLIRPNASQKIIETISYVSEKKSTKKT